MPDQPQYLILGKILRPHGVRGDFNIQIVTDFPERLSQLDNVILCRDPEKPRKMTTHEVTWARPNKSGQWLIHLEGIETRDEAEPYREHYLIISLKDAVPLEEDEVYLFQVMGCEVHTTTGEMIGHVTDIIETGANDVYVLKSETYGEVLIPAIPGVVMNIDVETKIMTVQLPEGLLPE